MSLAYVILEHAVYIRALLAIAEATSSIHKKLKWRRAPWHRYPAIMPQCTHRAITTGRQCRNDSLNEQELCAKHHVARQALLQRIGPLRQGGCAHITTGPNARRCDRFAEAEKTLCINHRRLEEKQQRQRAQEERDRQQQEEYGARFRQANTLEGGFTWVDAIIASYELWHQGIMGYGVFYTIILEYCRHIHGDYDHCRIVMRRLYQMGRTVTIEQAILYINEQGQPGAAAAAIAGPAAPLAAIAADSQNVHTRVVTQQTNAGLEKILAAPVEPEPFTLTKILRAFISTYKFKNMKAFLSMMTDMATWYDIETCRTDKDWLYRKVLDGAWSLIDSSPDKNALTMRLYEEAKEASGLCCDGHISRLINVFVGFDTVFETPISMNEMIQNRMSAIAARETTVEEKVRAAAAEFDELGVPAHERQAWLEAF